MLLYRELFYFSSQMKIHFRALLNQTKLHDDNNPVLIMTQICTLHAMYHIVNFNTSIL